jgi:hypothetical protein
VSVLERPLPPETTVKLLIPSETLRVGEISNRSNVEKSNLLTERGSVLADAMARLHNAS